MRFCPMTEPEWTEEDAESAVRDLCDCYGSKRMQQAAKLTIADDGRVIVDYARFWPPGNVRVADYSWIALAAKLGLSR